MSTVPDPQSDDTPMNAKPVRIHKAPKGYFTEDQVDGRKKGNFLLTDAEPYRDPKMVDLELMGLLAHLMTLPPGYDTSAEGLAASTGRSVRHMKDLIMMLEARGWVTREEKIVGGEYHYTLQAWEVPSLRTGFATECDMAPVDPANVITRRAGHTTPSLRIAGRVHDTTWIPQIRWQKWSHQPGYTIVKIVQWSLEHGRTEAEVITALTSLIRTEDRVTQETMDDECLRLFGTVVDRREVLRRVNVAAAPVATSDRSEAVSIAEEWAVQAEAEGRTQKPISVQKIAERCLLAGRSASEIRLCVMSLPGDESVTQVAVDEALADFFGPVGHQHSVTQEDQDAENADTARRVAAGDARRATEALAADRDVRDMARLAAIAEKKVDIASAHSRAEHAYDLALLFGDEAEIDAASAVLTECLAMA